MLRVPPFSFADTGTDRIVPALICVSLSLGENLPADASIRIPSYSPELPSSVGRSTLLAAVKSQLLSSTCAVSSCADTGAAVPAADTVPAIILTVMATERRPAKNALFIFFLLTNFIMKFECGFYHSSAKVYSPPTFFHIYGSFFLFSCQCVFSRKRDGIFYHSFIFAQFSSQLIQSHIYCYYKRDRYLNYPLTAFSDILFSERIL